MDCRAESSAAAIPVTTFPTPAIANNAPSAASICGSTAAHPTASSSRRASLIGARSGGLSIAMPTPEDEFPERFVRIHRNCLVARHEIVELKRATDGHVHAVLRHGKQPLEVSRRCVSNLARRSST